MTGYYTTFGVSDDMKDNEEGIIWQCFGRKRPQCNRVHLRNPANTCVTTAGVSEGFLIRNLLFRALLMH